MASVLQDLLGVTELRQLGGRGDGGVDITAKWPLDANAGILYELIVQCKRITRKGPPIIVREIEGTVLGSGKPLEMTAGIIASTQPPSEACIERLAKSSLMLMYLQIQEQFVERMYSSRVFKAQLKDFAAVPRRIGSKQTLEFYYKSVPLRKPP